MNWQMALLLLALVLLALDCVVGIIADWHKRPSVIPYREINEHRITLRFCVGGDAK